MFVAATVVAVSVTVVFVEVVFVVVAVATAATASILLPTLWDDVVVVRPNDDNDNNESQHCKCQLA